MSGMICVIGFLSGITAEISTAMIFNQNVRIQGIQVGSREMFESMNRAIALHQLHPVVDRVFPFEEAQEAFRYFETRSHVGKVVIQI